MTEGDKALLVASLAGGALWLVGRRGRAPVSPAVPTRAPELPRPAGPLGLPTSSRSVHRVSLHGHFGSPRTGPPVHTHQGVDLLAPPGSAVLAVGDGTIIPALPGLGQLVLKLQLDQPARWSEGSGPRVSHVVYADLGQALVHPGERVQRGQPIARVWDHGFVHFATKVRTPRGEEFFNPALAGFPYQIHPSDQAGALVARNARGVGPWRTPLAADGVHVAEWVRQLRGKNGVYLLRDSATREVLYIGESHSARLFETLTRHLYNWQGRGSGPSYRPERVEIAVLELELPADAIDEQFRWIRKLSPRDNVQDGASLLTSADESVPF